ncbi:MAG: putative rane spanning protein [Bacteroidetes bacterium]|nr:putative rane spanning protein [Bacteroidota bacterium]
MVDGHTLTGLTLWLVFSVFIGSLAAYSFALYRLWRAGELSLFQVRIVSYALAAIFSLMLPMLSNDLFSLLTYGDAANRGVDVYTNTASLPISPFFEFLSLLWRKAPCVYGPVCLSISRIAAYIGHGHLWYAMAAYKVLAFIWAIVFIEIIFRIGVLLKTTIKPILFIVLNPLFMIPGLAQLHCDAIVITLAAGMVYFFLAKKGYIAFVFLGLCIAAKISYILLFPFLIIALFLEKTSWMSFFTRIAGGVAITLVTVFLLYLPFYTSPKTFTIPFDFLFHQNPAKSISEIVGDIVYFAPTVMLGENAELHNNVKTPSGISQGQLDAWLLIKMICQVFALIISAVVFIRFWMGERSVGQWFRVFTRLLLLFLLFYSHVFYPWYLLFILPLLWFEEDLAFMQWLFVLTCFSTVQDAICFITHDTLPYYIILILTFFSTVVFVWRFRTVYFGSLQTHSGQSA